MTMDELIRKNPIKDIDARIMMIGLKAQENNRVGVVVSSKDCPLYLRKLKEKFPSLKTVCRGDLFRNVVLITVEPEGYKQ